MFFVYYTPSFMSGIVLFITVLVHIRECLRIKQIHEEKHKYDECLIVHVESKVYSQNVCICVHARSTGIFILYELYKVLVSLLQVFTLKVRDTFLSVKQWQCTSAKQQLNGPIAAIRGKQLLR